MEDRHLILSTFGEEEVLELEPAATRYVVWRMVEIGVMDKHERPPDLGRWLTRATRRMGVEEVPDDDDPRAEEFWDLYMRLSEKERQLESKQHGVVGAYKLSRGDDWVVTAREAATLAEATIARAPRRHKMSAAQQQLVEDWVAFNQAASSLGGYTVSVVYED